MTNYNVVFGTAFKKSIKKLKKRFPSVKKDVSVAIEVLLENPKLGVLIPEGSGVRKLRVRNSDMKRGKSGSYRLLYYFEEQTEEYISLLLLYAKSDIENITSQEIRKLLDEFADSHNDNCGSR